MKKKREGTFIFLNGNEIDISDLLKMTLKEYIHRNEQEMSVQLERLLYAEKKIEELEGQVKYLKDK